ncbi:MAG: DUF116 domain-containing protein [Nitrospirota bacterium]
MTTARVLKEKTDRHLGDEWETWQGKIEENIEEGKLLFLKFAGAGLFFVIGFVLFHLYMITPRLKEFGPFVSSVFFWAILLLIVLSGIWISVITISTLTEKKFFLFCGKKNILFMLNFILPLALQVGQKMGYSRDRLGNSFVKVNNSLTMAIGEKGKKGYERLLVILPRCLREDIRKRFVEISKTYDLEYFTAGGGKAALRIIEEKSPSAIIGIACERDLINGIREVAPKIPVIGIPNKRPEGPCKNTSIDFNSLEKAIRFFKEV